MQSNLCRSNEVSVSETTAVSWPGRGLLAQCRLCVLPGLVAPTSNQSRLG